ncbi:DUF3990 domain-containing protein [Adlercreutzia sp. ZJ138]|uniref:DUF3990 domain-containing protein n=1 Tax=Adlercreutzia sp. ZJ138 TaxID=2709405 RepID=UPI00351B8480
MNVSSHGASTLFEFRRHIMIVFHASTLTIEKPLIMNRFKTLDFGTGFYTTTNEDQAQDFARKIYFRRGRIGTPTVNVYEFDTEKAQSSLEFLEFKSPDELWLDFVVNNRRHGRSDECNANVIIGPVANDDVFETIALYESGQIDKDIAIKRFKVKSLFDQILFCDDKALDYIRFITSYALEVPK